MLGSALPPARPPAGELLPSASLTAPTPGALTPEGESVQEAEAGHGVVAHFLLRLGEMSRVSSLKEG